MEIYLLPFLSVILGYAIAFFIKPEQKAQVKLLLAFSGSFLLTITVTHLLPSIYEQVIEAAHHSSHTHKHSHGAFKVLGLFIMLGILFQIILEYFSKGAEHGHTHAHGAKGNTPWLLFFSLCVHAFFEGMPISNHHNLAWAIAVHHLPIAIILTLFFLNAGIRKKHILIFMVVFALMTPFGAFFSEKTSVLNPYIAEISAFVVGILFHISSTIIFESSEGHKFNARKLVSILLGIALAMLL